ncbi:MAG TPA: class I mannose-6-phosphate isomerase [Firmicutes bacterium]|nr:class I mannose-6-phosphate isomerase [Bacillota bacterium]
MAQNEMIKLIPVFKDYIWGGTKIRDLLKKDTGEMEHVAESWEFSTHPDGQSVIANGKYAGKTLSEYFSSIGWKRAGAYGEEHKCLPFMVKFIDARENLSIQVHPTEAYAHRHENDNGKNEMWYIVDAEEDAFIYVGFNRDTNRKEVSRRVKEKSIEEILNKIPVRKGDSFFIPAGTVHAIGAGCLICEIQQTSNITYRLYDYGRLGADGKPRELNLKKALDVLNYRKMEIEKDEESGLYHIGATSKKTLAKTNWFTVTKYEVDGDLKITSMRSPYTQYKVLIVVDGEGEIERQEGLERSAVGYTWLLKQQAPLHIHGHCSLLVVNL